MQEVRYVLRYMSWEHSKSCYLYSALAVPDLIELIYDGDTCISFSSSAVQCPPS